MIMSLRCIWTHNNLVILICAINPFKVEIDYWMNPLYRFVIMFQCKFIYIYLYEPSLLTFSVFRSSPEIRRQRSYCITHLFWNKYDMCVCSQFVYSKNYSSNNNNNNKNMKNSMERDSLPPQESTFLI